MSPIVQVEAGCAAAAGTDRAVGAGADGVGAARTCRCRGRDQTPARGTSARTWLRCEPQLRWWRHALSRRVVGAGGRRACGSCCRRWSLPCASGQRSLRPGRPSEPPLRRAFRAPSARARLMTCCGMPRRSSRSRRARWASRAARSGCPCPPPASRLVAEELGGRSRELYAGPHNWRARGEMRTGQALGLPGPDVRWPPRWPCCRTGPALLPDWPALLPDCRPCCRGPTR